MMRELDSFRLDESGLSPAYFLSRALTASAEHVDALEEIVRRTHRSARICMFPDSSSPLHAMIISQPQGMDSLPRVLATKPKLFMPLRGRLVLVKLDVGGVVESAQVLMPGRDMLSYVEPRKAYLDLPVDEVTTHLEITLGPHDRIGDRNFPRFDWDISPETRTAWRRQQIDNAMKAERKEPKL
jgi:hypothetical protein